MLNSYPLPNTIN